MFDLTEEDVKAVYEQLKDRCDLTLTNAFAVDDGFEADCAILVARRKGYILWLYEWGGEFVLDVLNEEMTAGTHWHPDDVEDAVEDITAFMDGKSDYKLFIFPQP